ncbi:MAG TPA: S9 family peptidase [Burkholderiaceae bacterium]|jgi:dipeptidyl aminopeptidase/acylaminoacyl peptidase|nr:S9 family peptidase [Burkholderiaceae bacterium]
MTYSVERHIELRRLVEIACAPDGSWLAVTVQRLDRDASRYVSDLWKVPVDGSAAVQLTRGDSRDAAPCFRRDGSLAFLSNRQPNEVKPDEESDQRMQVWLLPAQGGEPQQVTDEPLGVAAFRFARSADRLVVLAPVLPAVPADQQRKTALERHKQGPTMRRLLRQPVRHWDQWLDDDAQGEATHVIAYHAAPDAPIGERTDLTPQARREFAIEPDFDVAPDGRLIAITRASAGADRCEDTDVLLIDADSAAARAVGSGPGANCQWPRFSPDGRTLSVVRSVRSPRQAPRPTLELIDVASAARAPCASTWDRWPVQPEWSLDGASLLACADDSGDVPVFAIDARSGSVRRCLPSGSGGTCSHPTALPDGGVAMLRSSALHPPEVFVLEPGFALEPRPLAPLSGFEPAGWAACERIQAASTDGTPIHCLLVKPAESAGPAPLVLWIHGGPMTMSGDGWHWRWNPLLLAAQGFAVALPNPRGSTGFGQQFVQAIWGNVWGDQCYRDLMAVADTLCQRPDIDAQRTAAMGGSFGGYMVNWIGTQTERFACLVSHAGIVNMAAFTGVTDHPPEWYLEMGGENPYLDPQQFDRFAPIRYIRQWRTPTLITHGERDYRCPIGEALTLFEALQYHGVASELLVFPDENHWVLKPRNVVAWYRAVLEFTRTHLAAR